MLGSSGAQVRAVRGSVLGWAGLAFCGIKPKFLLDISP